MAGRGQKYTQEFKDSTIQLALNSEKSVYQVAKDLDLCDKTLYQWLRVYRINHNLEQPIHYNANKNKSSTHSLEEENRLLRRELASVKKDREILKKAAAPQKYFLATLTARTSQKKLYKVRLDQRA
jgi:transposase